MNFWARPHYPSVVANEWIKEEPEEAHEENPEVGPKEYQEMDYEGEILSETYPSGPIPNQHTEQENLTDHQCSLKEEVATVRQKLITAEARAALAEQRAEEATREMSEMVEHLVCYFGMWASLTPRTHVIRTN